MTIVTGLPSRRIMLGLAIALIVLGALGAIFAQDELQRIAQIISIGMGALGLFAVLVILPWEQRRAGSQASK
jgi:uncharacterized membrane protein YedE/YeeE